MDQLIDFGCLWNSLLYLTSVYLKEKGEPHGSPSPKYDGHKVAKFL